MGEYQALLRSDKQILDSIVPLIEIAEIGYDFEKQKVIKTVDEHLELVGKRVRDKLGCRPCFVDMRHISPAQRMSDGRHPAEHVFNELRSQSIPAVPVFRLSQDEALFRELQKCADRDQRGICLRASLEETSRADFGAAAHSLLRELASSPSECHFVLDLKTPNFIPVDGLTRLLKELLGRLPHRDAWRSLTLLGTSFPRTTAEIPLGLSRVERYEWIVYTSLAVLLERAGMRIPRFGDYAIAHPAVILKDMRYVKPNATVRYTVDNAWLVAKGLNVRDHKFGQYRELCQMIIQSGRFEGKDYSLGDEYIADCAVNRASTGILTTWRWVGTSHHLAKVVRDLSSWSVISSSL
ncbi:MAG: beta family protein [Thermoleophilia bacterium]|nr:beta family protein [Thermoleophilia bacterium]